MRRVHAENEKLTNTLQGSQNFPNVIVYFVPPKKRQAFILYSLGFPPPLFFRSSACDMGNAIRKPATTRAPPARFIARQLPRAATAVAEDFKKAKHTMAGINQEKERVSNTPQPFIHTKITEETTSVPDHAPPRWYLNTWLEMVDNTRQDRTIITGNLPVAWERDRFEPYTLIRNRIDDEDLDWLLSTDAQSLKKEDLVDHTKLELSALEDILATVELPRRQFRNYQGKLHKAIDDANVFLADRKKRAKENREDELLRSIGFSDEEMADDKQYREKRSRGVKTLDDLGATIRSKKRTQRISHFDDMQQLLDARKQIEIEAGEVKASELTPAEVGRNVKVPMLQRTNRRNRELPRTTIALDHNKAPDQTAKIAWWQEERRKIERGIDVIHGVPEYADHLSQTEAQLDKSMERSSELGKVFSAAQGGKGYFDPRTQYEEMLKSMRVAKERDIADAESRTTPRHHDGGGEVGSSSAAAGMARPMANEDAAEAEARAFGVRSRARVVPGAEAPSSFPPGTPFSPAASAVHRTRAESPPTATTKTPISPTPPGQVISEPLADSDPASHGGSGGKN